MEHVSFDDVERARLALDELRVTLSGLHIYYDGRWLSESQAEFERTTFPSAEQATTAHCQGSNLIHVAADQLLALTKTLTNPVQTIAPWTCLRTMLESCALAAWLLDPSIDIETRVRRSFAWEFEGLEQELKYVRASGLFDEQIANGLEKVIDDLEETALKLGYQRIVNAQGRRIGIGQRMPPSTEVVKIVYGNDSPYRVTSAFIHGHFWAMRDVSFRAEPRASRTPQLDEQEGVVRLINDAHPVNLIMVLELAGMIFARPIWFHSWLYGWPLALVRQILDKWADTQGTARSRFWHDGTNQSAN
jgi:hypothetical protein